MGIEILYAVAGLMPWVVGFIVLAMYRRDNY